MSCFKDVFFWRQSLVLISDSLHAVGIGFMLSFSSVLNQAILSPNSTDIRVTPEEASWISASLGFAGVLGFCIIPPILQNCGRKTVHVGLNLLVGLGFLIFYFANSANGLFIGKFVQGMSTCGVTITVMILAEYCHAIRRGYFMAIKKASVAVGSLICHSLYFTWSWRLIALLGAMPSVFSTILIAFWPESPAYLAMQGKYEECDKSHTWLFGASVESRKNLEDLISAQAQRRDKKKKSALEYTKRIAGKFVRKDFMRPFLIVTFLVVIIEASGRYYMMTYIIQIVIEVTGDKSLAVYCSMGADVFTMLALATSGFVVRMMSRRRILFYFGYMTSALMYLISIVIVLKTKYNIGSELIWLTPSLILLNTFVCYVGVTPTAFTIIGEIFPLEHKGTASFATGIVFTSLYGFTVKYIPIIMKVAGVEAIFFIFGTCIVISLVYLHFILIETKDKTLQEIEDEIKGVTRTRENLLEKAQSVM